jgi:hypothetical protein
MPAIPLYGQQSTPSGRLTSPTVQSDGGAGVIRAIGSEVIEAGKDFQRQLALKEQQRQRDEVLRMQAQEDDARFWSARLLSQTELTAKRALQDFDANRLDDDTIAPKMAEFGEGYTAERMKTAPSPLHRKLAEAQMLQIFDRFASQALDMDAKYDKERKTKTALGAVDDSEKLIQVANEDEIDTEFTRQTGLLGATLKNSLMDPSTRAALMERARSALVLRSGQRLIELNPDGFLRQVGADDDAKLDVWAPRFPENAQTRGIRNNNPLNVKGGGQPWKGGVAMDGPFVRFATPEHGVRAAGRVLLAYRKRGLDTLAEIIPTYAPESNEEDVKAGRAKKLERNDTAGYLARVAQRLGVSPDQPIDVRDERVMTSLLQAMAIEETGREGAAVLPEVFQKGVRAALGKEPLGEYRAPGSDEKNLPPPIESPNWWKMATAEERDRMLQAGRRAAEQRKAEEGDSLRTWLQNAEALAKAGQVPQGAPSLETAVRIYGPDRGRQVYEQGQSFVRLGSNIAGLADASDEDIARRLQGMRPDPRNQNTFAVNQGAFQDLAQAAEAVQKERRKKPLEWALAHNPSVNKAARTYQQVASDSTATPEEKAQARREYTSKARVAQRRYGIAQPTLLTEAEADAVADAFNDPRRYEQAADMIQGLQDQWGEDWPAVYGQLSKQLPPTADVIASGLPRKTASTLARLAPLKLDDMRKGAAPDVRATVKQTLDVGFDPFARSLLLQDPAYGREKAGRFRNEAEKLALHYVGQGMSSSDAAASAVRELTGNYEFVNQDGLVRDPLGGRYGIVPTYRFPAKKFERSAIIDGARRVKMSVRPDAVQVPMGITPEDYTSGIHDEGYWITSPDESGLELHYAGDPVNRPDGTPIRIPFEMINEAAAPAYWRTGQNKIIDFMKFGLFNTSDLQRRVKEGAGEFFGHGLARPEYRPETPLGPWATTPDASKATPYKPIFSDYGLGAMPQAPEDLFR